VVGSGSYLIAHNSIDCGWADGATGINVFARAFAPEASAIVVDNDVTMSAPEGTVFGASSAGIQIRGFAQSNSVLATEFEDAPELRWRSTITTEESRGTTRSSRTTWMVSSRRSLISS